MERIGWIASRTESSLLLVHVLGKKEISVDPDLSGSIGLGARTALLEELAEIDGQRARLVNKRGRVILDDALARVEGFGTVNATTMLRHGRLLATMEDLESQTDLIIIGKRGEGSHLDQEHIGSKLERIARSTSKPVFVASREYQPIKKILIAFDGGASAIKAVEYIATHSAFTDLECLLIQVGNEGAIDSKALGGAAATLTEAGYNAAYVVTPGQPETVIANTIESQGFDMLVMGAYGHSRIRNLIIGSTTTQMIRACKVPVLLFR